MNEVQKILANYGIIENPVSRLEIELMKYPQVECSVFHHFSPGLYIREVSLPKGTLAIGHYQKTRHLNIFLKGKVTMINGDGSIENLEAPMIFTSDPGRKCGYINEDVVWLNIYPTECRDIDELEKTYLDKSTDWLDWESRGLQKLKNSADREDFKQALKEYGFSEEIAKMQSENTKDQMDFPDGTYNVAVFDSSIHGKGLFASAPIKKDEYICPARLSAKRTPAGRYVNHSLSPNAEFKKHGNDIHLYAIADIKGCHGGINGDEITVDYRNSFKLQGLRPCQP